MRGSGANAISQVQAGGDFHFRSGDDYHFHAPTSPTGHPPQLPRRPEHFTGRGQEVDDLMAALIPGRVVTLWGPGGIGKSAVAAEALHRLTNNGTGPPAQFSDGVIWHEFYNAPEALRALEHIARSFGQTPDPTPREAALRALAGRKAIILLDGAEDADDLPAVLSVTGGCGVIVTTRNRHDAGPDCLEINALPDEDSAALLKAWGRDQTGDAQAVRRICDLLGGLPLAIRLVGGYLDETGDTAAEYLEWLDTTPLDALDQGDRKRDSVPLLLKRSLDQVSQTARDILSIAGILAFAPVSPDAWPPLSSPQLRISSAPCPSSPATVCSPAPDPATSSIMPSSTPTPGRPTPRPTPPSRTWPPSSPPLPKNTPPPAPKATPASTPTGPTSSRPSPPAMPGASGNPWENWSGPFTNIWTSEATGPTAGMPSMPASTRQGHSRTEG